MTIQSKQQSRQTLTIHENYLGALVLNAPLVGFRSVPWSQRTTQALLRKKQPAVVSALASENDNTRQRSDGVCLRIQNSKQNKSRKESAVGDQNMAVVRRQGGKDKSGGGARYGRRTFQLFLCLFLIKSPACPLSFLLISSIISLSQLVISSQQYYHYYPSSFGHQAICRIVSSGHCAHHRAIVACYYRIVIRSSCRDIAFIIQLVLRGTYSKNLTTTAHSTYRVVERDEKRLGLSISRAQVVAGASIFRPQARLVHKRVSAFLNRGQIRDFGRRRLKVE